MTIDPDAPATLRNVAEMMRVVFDVVARDLPSTEDEDLWSAFNSARQQMNKIATAPAVAKAGDARAEFPPGVGALNMDSPGDPIASPADPFAPMVEAALETWFKSERLADFDTRMRRALAAAISAAPCTDAMMSAWFGQHPLLSSGYEQVWRAMADALAADMEGGR